MIFGNCSVGLSNNYHAGSVLCLTSLPQRYYHGWALAHNKLNVTWVREFRSVQVNEIVALTAEQSPNCCILQHRYGESWMLCYSRDLNVETQCHHIYSLHNGSWREIDDNVFLSGREYRNQHLLVLYLQILEQNRHTITKCSVLNSLIRRRHLVLTGDLSMITDFSVMGMDLPGRWYRKATDGPE